MFPSRNWDYIHWKEATLQPYALILCSRLLSGHTPSHFSFIQVFFSLNAIFSCDYSTALTRNFTPLPQYICISVGVGSIQAVLTDMTTSVTYIPVISFLVSPKWGHYTCQLLLMWKLPMSSCPITHKGRKSKTNKNQKGQTLRGKSHERKLSC